MLHLVVMFPDFHDLDSFEGYTCRLFFTWDLSDDFLMIILDVCVLGLKTTEVKYLFHYSISWIHTLNITFAVGVDLDHLAEVMFVRLFHCKVTSFHGLWNQVMIYNLLKEWAVMLHLLEGGVLKKLSGVHAYLSVFPIHSFTHLYIFVKMVSLPLILNSGLLSKAI